MPSLRTSSRGTVFIAALGGAAFSCVLTYLIVHRNANQQIQSMQQTISTLQASLNTREAELKSARLSLLAGRSVDRPKEVRSGGTRETTVPTQEIASRSGVSSLQILKDLERSAENDPQSYAEKLQQLLSDNGSDEAAAIASRFILEKAGDQEGLPDSSLQSIYSSQFNPDLRRVIAQVLSQRGNNTLLNGYVAETQVQLGSSQAPDRLEALSRLGKLHSTRAVTAIAPLLQDSDSTVKLAALFALRDNGNQQHVGLAESMISDPDPSVSTLAESVANSLRNLSSSAHTSFSRADIEGELPPIANP
jgi:HEAT repeat protein